MADKPEIVAVEALVILPSASTVITGMALVDPYEPAVTAVDASSLGPIDPAPTAPIVTIDSVPPTSFLINNLPS